MGWFLRLILVEELLPAMSVIPPDPKGRNPPTTPPRL